MPLYPREDLMHTAGVPQIVANSRNGLDVDKYDYLQRDSLYCNTKISVDIKRIFSFVKVLCPYTSALICRNFLYNVSIAMPHAFSPKLTMCFAAPFTCVYLFWAQVLQASSCRAGAK